MKNATRTLFFAALIFGYTAKGFAQTIRYMDDSGNIIFVERIDQVPTQYRYQLIPPTPTPDLGNRKAAQAYKQYLSEKKRKENEKKREEKKKQKEEEKRLLKLEKEKKKWEKQEAKRRSREEKNKPRKAKEYGSRSIMVEPVKPKDKNTEDLNKE